MRFAVSLLASACSPGGDRALSSQDRWFRWMPVFLLLCLRAGAVVVSGVMSWTEQSMEGDCVKIYIQMLNGATREMH